MLSGINGYSDLSATESAILNYTRHYVLMISIERLVVGLDNTKYNFMQRSSRIISIFDGEFFLDGVRHSISHLILNSIIEENLATFAEETA